MEPTVHSINLKKYIKLLAASGILVSSETFLTMMQLPIDYDITQRSEMLQSLQVPEESA